MLRNLSLRSTRPGRYAVLAVLVLLILAGCSNIENMMNSPTITPPPPGGTIIDPPIALDDFTLIDQNGEPFNLSDLAGQPALFYFGYTFCPDVCPLTLAEMRQTADLLGEDASDVAFVFVSVDIQRDTPERLSEYLTAFNPDFIGLTAESEEALQPAVDTFGIYYELEEVEDSAAGYLVGHTSSTFLVDGQGQLRIRFAYQTPPQVIADNIENLLVEGSAAG